ncbi:MAG: ROK family protein [Clostridiales bacterium]|jgi:glucokinase|nr:ROK family protein [Clostridiales bacterium]
MKSTKYYVGLDIGGTTIKCGIVDRQGAILCQDKVNTRVNLGIDRILDDIYDLIDRLCKSNDISMSSIVGIGVGSPGIINNKGVLLYSNNLKCQNVDIKQHLQDRFGMSTYVANDADAAALGEALFGSGGKYDNVLFLIVGTGLGGGYVSHGRLFSGGNGIGMELGHTVIYEGGRLCSCGLHGCMEAYCSAISLINIAKQELGKTELDLMDIWSNYEDSSMRAIIDKYIQHFAIGVINFINIFRPDIVLIGGGASHTGDLFLQLLERAVGDRYYGAKVGNRVKFAYAQLQNAAGIIGAACLAMQDTTR